MSENLENMFANAILKDGAERIQNVVETKINEIKEDLSKRIDEAREQLNNKVNYLNTLIDNEPLNVNFGTIQEPKEKLVHKQFNTVLNILQSSKRINKNILLVGEMGLGKNHLCEQVAEALNLEYRPISIGNMTTKSDLIGFINATGNYITTNIREAYEHGGLCNIDEVDCGNANTLTILNALLANNQYAFPDKIVKKHEKFICICNANTYCKGGSIEYIGRNRLDSAFLDRFIVVSIELDEKLEAKLVNNKKWLKVINKIRKNIQKSGLKLIVSPRASMQGADLLDAGFDINEVLEMCVFKGVNEDVKTNILKDVDLSGFANSSLDVVYSNIRKPQVPKIKVYVNINFDDGFYNIVNLQHDENILGISDYAGSYNIYLSSSNSWKPTFNRNEICLNSGNGKFIIEDRKFVKHFIKTLNYHGSDIRLKDQILKMYIVYENETYEFEIG